MRNVTKIVLAGAPSGGKTAVLKRIAAADPLPAHTSVVFLPEAASALLQDIPTGIMQDLNKILLQYVVYRMQILNEETAIKNCREENLILISDRGSADAEFYLSAVELRMIGYEKRPYNLCIFLEGAPENFSSDKSANRLEKNFSEVLSLGRRSREVWQGAANTFVVVPQCDSVEEKVDRVVKQINDYLGFPAVSQIGVTL